jgi:hypothetical protein
MPNNEHVVMLARGAAAWNEWRAAMTRLRTYLGLACEGSI